MVDRTKYGQPPNWVVEDVDLTQLINAIQNIETTVRTGTGKVADELRKYYKEGASGSKRNLESDIGNSLKELVRIQNNITQGNLKASNLSKDDISTIKSSIRNIRHDIGVLSKSSRTTGRSSDIASIMRDFLEKFDESYAGSVLERKYKTVVGAERTPSIIEQGQIMQEVGRLVNNSTSSNLTSVLSSFTQTISGNNNYQNAINSRQAGNSPMGGMQYSINWSKIASPIEYVDISDYLEEIKKKIEESLNEITKEVSNIFNQMNRATAGTGPLNAPFNFGKDVVGRSNALGEAFESFGKLSTSLKNLKGMTKTVAGISKIVTLVLGAVLAIVARMFKASPILQAIGDLFDLAMNLFFLPLGNALGEAFLPLVTSLVEFMIRWNQIFTDFSLESLGELVLAGFSFLLERLNVYWNMITSAFFAIPSAVINAFIGGASDFFRSVGLDGVADVLDSFLGIYNSIVDFVKNIPDKIKEFVMDLPNKIGTFINDLPGKIGSIITTFFGAAGTFLTSFWPGLANTLGEALGGIGKGIGDTFSSSGTLGFLNPDNWHFGATGGIVTSAQPWIVGEAGPEAIIPLDEAGLFGSTYYITITGDVYGVSDLENRIEKAIQRTANKAYYR